MNNPLISIVIPTFNRAHLIGETLDSVMAQTYENWECIIVDDGSTDNTDRIIADYIKIDNRFQYHRRPENKLKGANSCRNFGAEISAGNYLIFLDSDDYLLDFCLSQRVEKINVLNDFSFAVFPMAVFHPTGEITEKNIPIKESYLEDFLSNKLHWGIMCSIWKKSYFTSLKGFSEKYPRLNDPDLHIRAIAYYPSKYHVFSQSSSDSVYKISENYMNNSFAIKVYHSIALFIPDIKFHLENTDNKTKIKFLKGYLQMWLSSNMNHASYIHNKEVLNLFYKNNIISLFTKINLEINIFVYFGLMKFLKMYRKKIIQKIIAV